MLRCFLAAMEKPLWTLLIAAFAILFNALAAWSLIFGHFGLPALGLKGAGIATTLSSTMMFLGLALVIVTHKKFRRYRLFGRFWRSDWPRLLDLWRPQGAGRGHQRRQHLQRERRELLSRPRAHGEQPARHPGKAAADHPGHDGPGRRPDRPPNRSAISAEATDAGPRAGPHRTMSGPNGVLASRRHSCSSATGLMRMGGDAC